jgi:HAE1 family hydrophobic/amphiphilic exporter-1
VIYLYLDRYSGKGPMTDEHLQQLEQAHHHEEARQVVLTKAA